MNQEIELKLSLAPEHAQRLRRHPLLGKLKQRRVSTKHLVSVYYDTSVLTLLHNRVALRIRKVGRERVQTIKCDTLPGQSSLVRGEWEQRIRGEKPDLSRLDVPELRALIEPHSANGDLKPMFVTDVTRRTWPLKIGATDIECALDIGEIQADGKSQPICEVELELKVGERKELFELARKLNRTVPLCIEQASKATRGYRLIAGIGPRPVLGGPVQLDSSMTVRAAFVTIVRACMGHIVANVDGAHHGEDPEGVHQLRVGIRRLRAALSLFLGVIPEQDRLSLVGELRWLQQELGPAREWDVLIQETFAPIAKRIQTGEGMQRLQGLAETHRADGYKRTRAVLDDPRYTDLLLRLESWTDGTPRNGALEAPAESEPDPLDRPIAGFAAEVLRTRHKKLAKLGRRIRKLKIEELHKLRIRVKKLRYAAEFFHDLWPKKAASRYIGALKDLQRVFGAAHDRIIAADLIATLEIEAGAGIEREAGLLHGWTAAHLKQDRKKLARLWDRFAELAPLWKNTAGS